jgi:putative transposase
MERKINFAVGEFYHIYNRGVEKRDIFLDDRDRKRFLRLLYVANSFKAFVFRDIANISYDDIKRGNPRVAIGAYCLMPNHFHLLVRETIEGGISTFMEKLGTGYSMYFNKRHTRVGPLFQGRFKAQHVDRDEYLKYLFSYIHLNPVKLLEPSWKESGIVDRNAAKRYLEDYLYSSYSDYEGTFREEKAILSREEFPDYFSLPHDFDSHVDDWLEFNEECDTDVRS